MFTPSLVLIERKALSYPMGRRLHDHFTSRAGGTEVRVYDGRIPARPRAPRERFRKDKETLVLRVRDNLEFQTCRPSAHYQLPLTTSCPGMCEYCYLHTSLAGRMYMRAYVNVDEILDRAAEYIRRGEPGPTVFEGAATSDPLPLEPYTGSLARTIEFFGGQPEGRFRFVTKFTGVDPLLDLGHGGRTRLRFSINAGDVIRRYEHRTPPLEDRLEAARRIADAGYPSGFIIAPIFLEDGYRELYGELLKAVRDRVGERPDLTFELITHRFTPRARGQIKELFPATGLPLDDEERRWKHGQFGYGKYIYPKRLMDEAREFFTSGLDQLFPAARIEYFI